MIIVWPTCHLCSRGCFYVYLQAAASRGLFPSTKQDRAASTRTFIAPSPRRVRLFVAGLSPLLRRAEKHASVRITHVPGTRCLALVETVLHTFRSDIFGQPLNRATNNRVCEGWCSLHGMEFGATSRGVVYSVCMTFGDVVSVLLL